MPDQALVEANGIVLKPIHVDNSALQKGNSVGEEWTNVGRKRSTDGYCDDFTPGDHRWSR